MSSQQVNRRDERGGSNGSSSPGRVMVGRAMSAPATESQAFSSGNVARFGPESRTLSQDGASTISLGSPSIFLDNVGSPPDPKMRVMTRLGHKLMEEKEKLSKELELSRKQLEIEKASRLSDMERYAKEMARAKQEAASTSRATSQYMNEAMFENLEKELVLTRKDRDSAKEELLRMRSVEKELVQLKQADANNATRMQQTIQDMEKRKDAEIDEVKRTVIKLTNEHAERCKDLEDEQARLILMFETEKEALVQDFEKEKESLLASIGQLEKRLREKDDVIENLRVSKSRGVAEEDENHALSLECARLGSMLNHQTRIAEDKSAEVQIVTDKLEAVERDLVFATEQHHSDVAKLETLESTVQVLQQTITELQGKVVSLESENAEMTEELEQMEEIRALAGGLRVELEEERANKVQRTSQSSANIDTIQQELDQEKSRCEELHQEIARKDAELEETTRKVQALEQELHTSADMVTSLGDQVTALTGELADEKAKAEDAANKNEKDAATLRALNQELMSKLQLVTANSASEAEEINNLQMQLNDERVAFEAERQELNNRIATLTEEMGSLSQLHSSLVEQVASLNQELYETKEASSAERDLLSAQLEASQASLQMTEMQTAEMQQTIDEMSPKVELLEGAQAKILEQGEELARLESENAQLREQVMEAVNSPLTADLTRQITELSASLEENERKLEETRKAEAEARANVDQLTKSHKQLEARAVELADNPLIPQLTEQITSLTQELEDANSALKTAGDREDALVKENQTLLQRLGDVSAAETSMTTVMTEQIASLSQELHQSEESLKLTRENEQSLLVQLETTQEEMDREQARLRAQLADLQESSAATVAELEKQVGRLSEDLELAYTEHDRLKASDAAFQAEHTEAMRLLEARLVDKSSQLAQKSQELEASETMVATLDEQVRLLSGTIEMLHKQEEDLRVELASIDADRTKVQADLEASEALVSSLNEQMAILQAEMDMNSKPSGQLDEKARQRLSGLEREVQLVKDEKLRFEKDLERVKDRNFILEKARKNDEELESKLKAADEDRVRAEEEVTSLKTLMKSLEEEKERIAAELAQMNETKNQEIKYLKSENYRIQNVAKQQAASRSSVQLEDLEAQLQLKASEAAKSAEVAKRFEDELQVERIASQALTAEVGHLKAKLEDEKERCASATSKLSSLQSSLSALEAENRAMNEQIAKLTSSLAETERLVAGSKRKVADEEESRDSVERKAMEGDIARLRLALENAEKEAQALAEVNAQLRSSEAEVSRLNQVLKQKEQQSHNLLSDVDARGRAKEEEIAALKAAQASRTQALESHIGELESSMKLVTASLATKDSEITSLRAQIQEDTKRLQNAQARIAELQGDGNSLVAKLQNQVLEERQLNEAYSKKIETMSKQLTETLSAMDELTLEVARVGKLLNEEQRKTEKAKAENDDMKKRLERSLKDVEEAAAPSIRLGEKIMALTEQLENERSKKEQLESDNRAFSSEVERLGARLADEMAKREKAEAAAKSGSRPRRSSVLESSNV